MIKLLVGPLVDLAKDWFQRRADKAQAKHERELRKINGEIGLDTMSAEDMRHSWKDEWLTIIFTVPMVVVFYGAIADDPAIIDRITLAVQTITELPEWYVHIMYGIVAASFGLHTFNAIKK